MLWSSVPGTAATRASPRGLQHRIQRGWGKHWAFWTVVRGTVSREPYSVTCIPAMRKGSRCPKTRYPFPYMKIHSGRLTRSLTLTHRTKPGAENQHSPHPQTKGHFPILSQTGPSSLVVRKLLRKDNQTSENPLCPRQNKRQTPLFWVSAQQIPSAGTYILRSHPRGLILGSPAGKKMKREGQRTRTQSQHQASYRTLPKPSKPQSFRL